MFPQEDIGIVFVNPTLVVTDMRERIKPIIDLKLILDPCTSGDNSPTSVSKV